jgi:fatty acid desaturase
MTLADTSAPTPQHADAEADTEDAVARKILLTLLLALVGWGLAIAQWGIPGLYIPALALVPAMYVLLILISRG